MKTCTKCNQVKPLDEFSRDNRMPNGRMARCKTCKAESLAKYRKTKGYDKKRYWSNRDKERERHLVKKYGVTLGDYAVMLANQNGACAICGRPEPENRTLDVDHCHATGLVRGLLCTSCNRMLGHANDDACRLLSAAEYLKSFPKSRRRSSGRT